MFFNRIISNIPKISNIRLLNTIHPERKMPSKKLIQFYEIYYPVVDYHIKEYNPHLNISKINNKLHITNFNNISEDELLDVIISLTNMLKHPQYQYLNKPN